LLPVDLESFIRAVGYIGVTLIVFAESGLLIGFFLPGDSLLFTAGFLASQGHFDIYLLAILCFVAAVSGDAVGYWFGHRVGRRLFEREDSRFFKKKYLEQAEAFFERNGGKAIFLARFLPIVRTFTPIVAGAASMRYARFAFYNAFGALAWAVGVTVAGYQLGSRIPGVDKYLLPIIAVIILVSVLPGAIHLWREHRASQVASAEVP
jgi:membrane-associated protein